MRKFYSTLKSVVAAALVGAMALSVSCSYDDTGVKNELEQIKDKLEALTNRVAALETKLQSEVDAVKALINEQVVITGVEKDADGNQTITLSNGETITVLAPVGCTCEPAAPCTCDPLQYRVVDGVLEVSADGIDWVAINGVTAECVVASIVVDGGVATVTLADGTVFQTAVAELVEFEAAKSAVYVKVAETVAIPFAINDAVEDINVMNAPLGWKAEIVDTRAVGGMDYLLNITGPAKNFLQYAEKSGKVAIHFNTAAGACKVMSVDVELAEITMDVDKAGNITIVNTLVDKYERENWGVVEYIQEFNNFYFAVLNYDDYYQYEGRLEEAYNSSWGEFNIPAAASYIQNFFTNVGENSWETAVYEDGVNEKWTLNFTVEEVIAYLDWYNYLSYEGNSFVLCAIPTDVNNNGNLIWDEIVAVPFKQLSLQIEENVENRTFQQPYFNVAFRGAQKYFFYPQTKSSLENYVSMGYYDTIYGYFEEALTSYLQYPSWYSFGYEVTSDIVEENISLAELLAYTSSYYYFETIPAAEYVMAYFAWEEGKTEYSTADLKYIEFSTADLVKAEPEFEVACEYNDDHAIYTIAVDVTVPETTAVAYTAWLTEEPADEESLYDYILSNGYARTEENFADGGYTWYIGTSCNAPETTKYLGVLVIDAAGNYTLKYFELTSKGIVMNDAVVTIDAVAFETSSATITVGGVDGLEVKKYKYYIISTDGNSYYQKTEEDLQDLAYGSNWLYKSSEVNPIVATQTADYKNSFTEGKTYKVAVAVEFADGSYSTTAYGEYAFSAGEDVGGDVEVVTYTEAYTSGSLSDVNIIFKNEAGDKICLNFYGCTSPDLGYLPEATYYVTYYGGIYAGGYSYVDLADGSYMNVNDGSAIVSEVDGKYRFEINLLCGATNSEYKAVYEGLVTGLILPSEYVAPEPEPEPETSGFVAVRADYDFKFDLYEYNGGDAEYAFWLYDAEGNYLEIIYRFSPFTDWNSQYEGKYVTADGSYSVAMKTIATQKPNTWNCADGELYFVVEAVSEDGLTYMCQDQLPATERNFIGGGSEYAPGSEAPEAPEQPETPEGGEDGVTELVIVDWFCSYNGGSEKEIGWWDDNGHSIVIDFLANPITPDTYTLADGLSGMYTKYRGVGMTSCTVVVTDAGDGNLAFDVNFSALYQGETVVAHFTWVGDPTTL